MNDEPIPRWQRHQAGIERFKAREQQRNANGEIHVAERVILIAVTICVIFVGVGVAAIAWHYR